ncbi:MAG: hypothetical protein Q8R36_04470 [bacterium]|nr:hypothetical protein [bacterium]
MLRFVKDWYKKWRTKQMLSANFIEMVELDFRGVLKEKWGMDYDTARESLMSRYLAQGLTRKEIDRVLNDFSPVCIG